LYVFIQAEEIKEAWGFLSEGLGLDKKSTRKKFKFIKRHPAFSVKELFSRSMETY
jgi:hypothetical protein